MDLVVVETSRLQFGTETETETWIASADQSVLIDHCQSHYDLHPEWDCHNVLFGLAHFAKQTIKEKKSRK